MKKFIFLYVFSLLIAIFGTAQKRSVFNFSGGLSLLAGWKNNEGNTLLPSITLSPGIKFIQSKNFALVVDLPVTAGWNFKKGTYFGIDVPLMLNLNFGSAAANNDSARFGILIGAGLGYTNLANYEVVNTSPITQTHITGHTEFWGYRFKLGASFNARKNNGNAPAIVFNFGKSINSNQGYLAGISLLLMLNLNTN